MHCPTTRADVVCMDKQRSSGGLSYCLLRISFRLSIRPLFCFLPSCSFLVSLIVLLSDEAKFTVIESTQIKLHNKLITFHNVANDCYCFSPRRSNSKLYAKCLRFRSWSQHLQSCQVSLRLFPLSPVEAKTVLSIAPWPFAP